eukprot:scaffold49193_cov18-Tisochrysis_lutea.AAC.1
MAAVNIMRLCMRVWSQMHSSALCSPGGCREHKPSTRSSPPYSTIRHRMQTSCAPHLPQIFEAKEKAIAEMGQLMAQAEKEQAGFEEEWRQLTQ